MENYFHKVRNYLLELEYIIIKEEEADAIFVISREDDGIKNLIISCEDPILIFEQPLFKLPEGNADIFRQLLIKNRDIVHGAFVLGEDGLSVIFRDTLQLENLDLNELEGSINSLSLLMNEYSNEMISFSKGLVEA